MRTLRVMPHRLNGARGVLRVIEISNDPTPRRRPTFLFMQKRPLRCDRCRATLCDGKCPEGCDERPTCPICHLSKSCGCTADDRHFYELAREKVLPGESLEHAIWRVRNEYNAQFAQQTLATLNEPEDNCAPVRKAMGEK